MSQITEFQIVDHGITAPDYFQGCGVSFTQYEHVATGIGNNFKEALDDCLEMIAQGEACEGVDFEVFERTLLESEGLEAWPEEPAVDEGEIDMYYHVSIRYNVS